MNHLHPEPDRHRGVTITLGFTESDRAGGYVSYADGYRPGAAQVLVTIALDIDGSDRSPQDWADAVFQASNSPAPATDPAVAAIRHALAEQVHTPMRSLSVGDTVTVVGQTWACEPSGWRLVDDGRRDNAAQ